MASNTTSIRVTGDVAGALAALEALGIKAEETGVKAETAFGDKLAGSINKTGGLFGKLGNVVSGLGLPFSESFSKIGDHISDAEVKGNKFMGTLAELGKVATVAGVAGFAVVAAESLKLGISYQKATSILAANADISVKAATSIGTAFLNTGFKTIYSAQEQMAAYSGVARLLSTVAGHALNTKEAMGFMTVAMDLAEESGTDLKSTTADLAQVMQTFQIPLAKAASTADTLFNASKLTGVGLDSLTSTLDRLKARLGVAAPTVQDLSTLMVDLAEHGVTGSRGLLVVNTAVTTLLKSTQTLSDAQAKAASTEATKVASARAAVTKATQNLQFAEQGLSDTQKNQVASASQATIASSQGITAAQEDVTKATVTLQFAQEKEAASSNLTTTEKLSAAEAVKQAQLGLTDAQVKLQEAQDKGTTAQNKLTAAQQGGGTSATSLAKAHIALATAQAALTAAQSGAGTVTNANVKALTELGLQVYNSKGQFVGMRDIIAELQPKLEKMTQQQQLAALSAVFGASASKSLLDVVLAGPAAYDKAQKAVTNAAAAHAALVVQEHTLGHETETLKSGVEDLGVKFGLVLIPILDKVIAATASVVGWFEKHKTVAKDLGIAIGILGGMLIAFGIISFIVENMLTLGIGLALAALVLGVVYLATHWKQVWSDIKQWTNDAVAFLRGPIGTLVQIIVLGPFAILTLLALHWQQILHDITAWTTDFWHDIDGIFNDFRRDVVDLFERLPGDIVGALDSGKNAVFNWFENLGSGMIHAIVSGITSVAGEVGGALQGVLNKIPGVSTLKKIPGLSFLAEGGIITQPTLAVVGEAGPEAVIPLNNPMLTAGGSIRPLSSASATGTVAAKAGMTNYFSFYTQASASQIAAETTWSLTRLVG
jgi:TP901 family phage tail tape measure protein